MRKGGRTGRSITPSYLSTVEPLSSILRPLTDAQSDFLSKRVGCIMSQLKTLQTVHRAAQSDTHSLLRFSPRTRTGRAVIYYSNS